MNKHKLFLLPIALLLSLALFACPNDPDEPDKIGSSNPEFTKNEHGEWFTANQIGLDSIFKSPGSSEVEPGLVLAAGSNFTPTTLRASYDIQRTDTIHSHRYHWHLGSYSLRCVNTTVHYTETITKTFDVQGSPGNWYVTIRGKDQQWPIDTDITLDLQGTTSGGSSIDSDERRFQVQNIQFRRNPNDVLSPRSLQFVEIRNKVQPQLAINIPSLRDHNGQKQFDFRVTTGGSYHDAIDYNITTENQYKRYGEFSPVNGKLYYVYDRKDFTLGYTVKDSGESFHTIKVTRTDGTNLSASNRFKVDSTGTNLVIYSAWNVGINQSVTGVVVDAVNNTVDNSKKKVTLKTHFIGENEGYSPPEASYRWQSPTLSFDGSQTSKNVTITNYDPRGLVKLTVTNSTTGASTTVSYELVD